MYTVDEVLVDSRSSVGSVQARDFRNPTQKKAQLYQFRRVGKALATGVENFGLQAKQGEKGGLTADAVNGLQLKRSRL